MIKIDIVRKGSARATLSGVMARLAPKVEGALIETGRHLLYEADLLVPRDTEILALSGEELQFDHGFYTMIVVGYGMDPSFARRRHSPSEGSMVLRRPYEYAIYVHEDTTKFHDHGQANFLREPASNYADLARVFRVSVMI